MIFREKNGKRRLSIQDIIDNIYSCRRGTGVLSFHKRINTVQGNMYVLYAYCFIFEDKAGNKIQGSFFAEENTAAKSMGVRNELIFNGKDVSDESYYLAYNYMQTQNSFNFTFENDDNKSFFNTFNVDKGFIFAAYLDPKHRDEKMKVMYATVDYTGIEFDGCISASGENEANVLSMAAFNRYMVERSNWKIYISAALCFRRRKYFTAE